MRISVFLVITLALGIFQSTFLEYFRIFGVKPDLLLACVVIAAIFMEPLPAIVFAALIGAAKDAFGLGTFGLNILLFSLWSFLVIKISRKVSIEDGPAIAVLAFIIAVLQNISTGLALVYSGSFVPSGIFLRIVLLGSLYTALTLPVILKLNKIKI